jgi:hypothetical protein
MAAFDDRRFQGADGTTAHRLAISEFIEWWAVQGLNL